MSTLKKYRSGERMEKAGTPKGIDRKVENINKTTPRKKKNVENKGAGNRSQLLHSFSFHGNIEGTFKNTKIKIWAQPNAQLRWDPAARSYSPWVFFSIRRCLSHTHTHTLTQSRPQHTWSSYGWVGPSLSLKWSGRVNLDVVTANTNRQHSDEGSHCECRLQQERGVF